MASAESNDAGSRRETISACLITLDEEERLPTALESVAFCDEVVVVDSGSADRTAEIARAAGAKVVENPWPGFAAQRNVAIDNATSEWILEVDADERVTPALRAEIETFLGEPPPAELDMIAVPLRDRFLGRELGPAAKYPKYRYRLFRRGNYRHDERRVVHEGLWTDKRVRGFTGDLEHELASSWREATRDTWNYARLDAEHGENSWGETGLLAGTVVRPAFKFGYRTFVLGGWRDGWQGLLKIALDCVSDVIVTVRRHRRPGVGGPPQRERAYAGPPRIAAVAAGSRATAEAARWLTAARDAGADVVVVTDDPAAADGVLTREVPRVGPFQVNRAVDAEEQMRVLDAVVPFGRRAERWSRALPRSLQGLAGTVPPAEGPDAVLAAVSRARESA